jgi:hypothetical protein
MTGELPRSRIAEHRGTYKKSGNAAGSSACGIFVPENLYDDKTAP